MTTTPRLFVTGAGGNLGRGVVESLLEAKAEGAEADVVAGSRDPGKLSDLAARGVELRRADFDDPEELAEVLGGIDRVLIISAPDTPQDPPLRLRQHLAAVEAAAKAGVGHISYTSMQKPEPGSAVPFAPDHHGTEQAIAQTGIPFTILRPNWYADSVFMWLPQVLATARWVSAAGDGRVAHVWRDDLARAAAAALLAGGTESRRLDISGPEALTAAEIVAIVNEVFGASVTLVAVSDADLAAGLAGAGLPAPLVELLVAIDVNTRNGGVATVTDAFEWLTGRRPRSLRDYLLVHRDALRAAARAIAQ
ncbi:NAD(P)H-binding protein [Paenirhodobacter populi]|uniref:SDR family NAD(P)-dependent oxidoreductase n=1 Tax=Paenirhodobacter populi TaxID=2306993 RepID=A0A443JGH0_9RHOB|nr:NAD(P)H-binding protein [Sinirhodobacter populi]RWR19514.1 SDR family NAD(P)-dependent oxidoreductase [Sinirhodobacter populi]